MKLFSLSPLLAFGLFFCFSASHAQIINTVAGFSSQGFSGDGGQATDAELNKPYGVVVDASGNLYIGDYNNTDVRIVDNTGLISNFAGTQVSGFSGDGGQAATAEMGNAGGLGIDSYGNIYIADAGNNRIRVVDPTGVINTIAGNGTAGYSGDGGQATDAELNVPFDATADAMGNVFIADYINHAIRIVNTAGVINTIAGTGTNGYNGDGGAATAADLNFPLGIALDQKGNLFIADYMNNRVRKVDTSGIITTIGGNGVAATSGDGGPATAAEINEPVKLAFDGIGNLYVAEYNGHRIRMIDTLGNISTIAGNGTAGFSGDGGLATAAQLNFPVGVTYNNGYLYVADGSNFRVRVIGGGPLAANKIVHKTSFAVYPNPSNGAFTLQVNSEKLKVNSVVEVYNMLGEKVYSSKFIPDSYQEQFTINLSDQCAGIYLLKLQSSDGRVVTKKIELAK